MAFGRFLCVGIVVREDGEELKDDLNVTAVGTFKDAAVEEGKVVTIANIAPAGDAAKNYELVETTTTSTAKITKREITFSGITAEDKVYDGTTDATLDTSNLKIEGAVAGEKVSVQVTGKFEDAEVGNNKVVNITPQHITGADKANYVLKAGIQKTTRASILPVETPALIVSGITADDKDYDGNAKANLNFDNVKVTDADGHVVEGVTVTANGTFVNETGQADLNAGEDKTVAITSIKILVDGEETTTYVVDTDKSQTTTTATIKRVNVTVTADDKSKAYGDPDPVLNCTVTGIIEGDTVDFHVGRDAGEDVGDYDIHATGAARQGNYKVKFATGNLEIVGKPVTVTANNASKTYKAKDPKLTAKVTGVVKGETVTYKLKRTKGQKVGTYKIKATGKALQGNYEVTYKTGKFTIKDAAKLDPEYSVKRMGLGWTHGTYDGDFSGSTGQERRMEAFTVKVLNKPYKGGITYRSSVEEKGWTGWVKDGAISGTWNHYLQALQIKLYGELAKHYDVYYRVHVKNYGWMAWTKNGKTAGTTKQGRRAEAVQIVILRKGSKAPSKTYKGVPQTYNKTSE